jgi:hypothetical protein
MVKLVTHAMGGDKPPWRIRNRYPFPGSSQRLRPRSSPKALCDSLDELR